MSGMVDSEVPKCSADQDNETLSSLRKNEHDESDELTDFTSKLSLSDCSDDVSLQCPFTWDLAKYNRGVARVSTKLTECDDDDVDISLWKHCALYFVLCYEYATRKDFVDALHYLTLCEESLRKAKERNISSSKCVVGVGLFHIYQACKMYVSLKQEPNSHHMSDTVFPIENMDAINQSSIWAMRASVLMEYGPEGTCNSVKFIRKALELYAECGEWHFLLGKALGRIRRFLPYKIMPHELEKTLLETAVQLVDVSSFKVMLAQVYRETSYYHFQADIKKSNQKLHKYLHFLNRKSSELYKSAITSSPNNVSVNIRCAMGFMKLPHPWKNLQLAENCITKALSLAPDNLLAIHVAGTFYFGQKDYPKAKKYYMHAGENGLYGAYMDLMRLKLEENPDFNPIPELERLTFLFQEKRQDIFCQQGSYFYYVKKDYLCALEYWSKAIEEDVHSKYLKEHRPLFVKLLSCNIIEIAATTLNSKVDFNNCSEHQKKCFSQLHLLIKDHLVCHNEHYPRNSEDRGKRDKNNSDNASATFEVVYNDVVNSTSKGNRALKIQHATHHFMARNKKQSTENIKQSNGNIFDTRKYSKKVPSANNEQKQVNHKDHSKDMGQRSKSKKSHNVSAPRSSPQMLQKLSAKANKTCVLNIKH